MAGTTLIPTLFASTRSFTSGLLTTILFLYFLLVSGDTSAYSRSQEPDDSSVISPLAMCAPSMANGLADGGWTFDAAMNRADLSKP